jgi:phenylacetic acid degradation operon negative regulatory protein
VTDPAPGPLTARSVLLSVLLGSHPPRLPVRTLIRTADLFGITEGTARVALSRLTADGDVVSGSGTYALSPRHLARQAQQDSSLHPEVRRWRGSWELALLLPGPSEDVASLTAVTGRALADLRLAEVHPGVWGRPDNLARRAVLPPEVMVFTGRPQPETVDGVGPVALAATLWDLEGWATDARALLSHLTGCTQPAERLGAAAAIVRHIRADPVLPAPLLPAGWPGPELRRAYRSYRRELGRLIVGLRDDRAARAQGPPESRVARVLDVGRDPP